MLEFVVRGLLIGSIYALLALPMSLMFATVATVDFAIGAYALLAAAVASSVAGPVGMLAAMLSALASSALMALIFLALRRGGGEQGIRIALASFGLLVAIGSLVLVIWGTQPFVLSGSLPIIELAGLRINAQSLVNMALSVGLVLGLHVLLRRTNAGRMMRASAANPSGAELAAIPVTYVQCGTILFGGLLGGIAGLLIVHGAGMDFTASLNLSFIGFAAAIVFGIQSPLRSLAGGIGIGVIEALAAGYTSGMLTTMIPSLFMLLVLLGRRSATAGLVGDRP